MIYGSVCSGIEAATVAWHGLGWVPAWYSEIEPFPCKVLKHYYPDVPNLGDMTRVQEKQEFRERSIELLVGGTPCQSFSVAGLRKGLADPRGNLALVFLGLIDSTRPRWVVWENVPGVLSSEGGRDFGAFLGGLAELGYGWAYRVLDAQYFGVAQRRRRVFVVASARGWASAAAVLFERASLSGDRAPSRQSGERIAPTVTSGAPFSRTGNERVEIEAMVAGSLVDHHSSFMTSDAAMAGHLIGSIAIHPHVVGRSPESGPQGKEYLEDGSAYTQDSRGVPQMVATFESRIARNGRGGPSDVVAPLKAQSGADGRGDGAPLVFKVRGGVEVDSAGKAAGKGYLGSEEAAFTLAATQDQWLSQGASVRRMMPIECERLQGFPDNYTNIPGAKDGPRYKALGNSMAVPVMKWIGERIQMVEDVLAEHGQKGKQ